MDQIHASALFFVIDESTVDWYYEKRLSQNSPFMKNIYDRLLLRISEYTLKL